MYLESRNYHYSKVTIKKKSSFCFLEKYWELLICTNSANAKVLIKVFIKWETLMFRIDFTLDKELELPDFVTNVISVLKSIKETSLFQKKLFFFSIAF